MFLPSILFMFIILYNGGLESYVQFVFGPPSSNPSHEPQSVLLEEIVVDPARCEIEPVNPSSDSNSNETVDGSIRLCRTQGPFLPHSHQGMEPRRSARIRNIHTQELSGPSTSRSPSLVSFTHSILITVPSCPQVQSHRCQQARLRPFLYHHPP